MTPMLWKGANVDEDLQEPTEGQPEEQPKAKKTKAPKEPKPEGEKKGPSFQVIRGKAIRAAVKDTAARCEVAPKDVAVIDTHKTGGDEATWTYNVLVELKDGSKRYLVQTAVEIAGEAIAVASQQVAKDFDNAKGAEVAKSE